MISGCEVIDGERKGTMLSCVKVVLSHTEASSGLRVASWLSPGTFLSVPAGKLYQPWTALCVSVAAFRGVTCFVHLYICTSIQLVLFSM